MRRFFLGMLLVFMTAGAAADAEEAASEQPIGVEARVELAIPPGAEAGPGFGAARATQAYLELMSPEQKERSDAYFEGGYWLQLWGFLYGLGVAALLLFTRLSAWLRDKTGFTRFPALNAAFYGAAYIVLTTLLSFPLTLYAGFYREHQYGLSNLSLGGWLNEQAIGLAVGIVLGMLVIGILYAVFRRAQRTWWMWGTGVAVVFLIFTFTIAPVFIAPLFNDYNPLPDGSLRESILNMARANQVPANDVYWLDASKQTKRISANVSGFLGTTRISLNDNLLLRTPQESIEAVMGHELGHYVLNHGAKHITSFAVVLFLGFAFVAWAYPRLAEQFAHHWEVRGIADPAGFPLLMALFSVWFFVMTPVTNSIIRSAEVEADIFGLNTARQADGFAHVAMQLSEYRKIKPGKWEEILFYDHPSGYNRVRMAMEWKQEQIRSGQLEKPER